MARGSQVGNRRKSLTQSEALMMDLVEHLIKKGTEQWREQAETLYETTRTWGQRMAGKTECLTSEDGAAVLWLWVTMGAMQPADVINICREALPAYHPYVQERECSKKVARGMVGYIDEVAGQRGLEGMERAFEDRREIVGRKGRVQKTKGTTTRRR